MLLFVKCGEQIYEISIDYSQLKIDNNSGLKLSSVLENNERAIEKFH